MAEALSVSDRSLQRWLSSGACPEGVLRDLQALVRQRNGEMQSLDLDILNALRALEQD
jgi:hypothetical protein